MRLEVGNIFINDIQFAAETKVENGVLYVNQEELASILKEDEHIASVEFFITKPGESVRITPVKDVIEPRVKVEGNGGIFPGFLSKVDVVGSGKTHVLKGAAVVTTGKIVGFQEGIIDMTGPGAEYTPFSKTCNLVVKAEVTEGLLQHAHEEALRYVGFKTAKYLGEAGRNVKPDEVQTYETKPLLEQIAEFPNLPKVAYVYMLQTQGLLHDTYVYGVDAKKIVPTIIYPTEVMDGAIVSGNCVSACDKNPTYVHMNNPIIHDLYKLHGKEYNFLGVIITNENVYLADKERSSNWSAKLAEYLGLDAVIISEEGFGNPDTDLMMNCKKVERKGIKVVLITDEFPGKDGKSQSLADVCEEATALASCGQGNMTLNFPVMNKIIGTMDYIESQIGGWAGCVNEDGSFEAEIQIIIASTIANGFNKLAARGY